MGVAVIRADARALPLPDASVDLIVTSPPFYQLRSYQDGGRHYAGQVGAEATVGEFLESLWEVTAECARILKPEGSIFVELGDSYAAKSLNMAPARYAIGCVDKLGLMLRAEIIWHHVNGLPESATDRVRRSHSVVFHFTRQPRYYSAIDEIREPLESKPQRRLTPHPQRHRTPDRPERGAAGGGFSGITRTEPARDGNPLGRLPGSVWEIASQPLTVPAALGVDHFACVDAETEILTRRGWLRHDALADDDEVAGCDLDSGLTRWTRLHGIHRHDFDGELVAAEARGLSMRLTPNHRVLAHRHAGRHGYRQPVEVIRADALTAQHSIPRAIEWAEDGREKSIGADLAALLGWVAAEGWYQVGRAVQLSQSATVNPEHVAEIDALLGRLGSRPESSGRRNVYPERGKWRARIGYEGRARNLGTYDRPEDAAAAVREFRAQQGIDRTYRSERVRDSRSPRPWTEVVWRLADGLGAEVRRLMPGKLLTPEMADLPITEAQALLEAFIAGDGHSRPDGRLSVFQKERTNLDVLQAIAVRCGFNTTLRPSGGRWVLYLNPPRPARLRRADGTSLVGRERYRGIVWCVTTGTGTFVARRNGTVFVTGNSFPMELPRRIIAGWSPPGICTRCSEGRRPVAMAEYDTQGRTTNGPQSLARRFESPGREVRAVRSTTITGYACACPQPGAPTRPAVVLDPFSGTGTTLLVADALGRHGIGADLSADYCRLARWRTSDPGERAKAFQVPKPPPVPEGQGSLFGEAS